MLSSLVTEGAREAQTAGGRVASRICVHAKEAGRLASWEGADRCKPYGLHTEVLLDK